MEENTDNIFLIYVRMIGENGEGEYEYELFFSETPDIVWGEDWAEQCPAAIGDIPPDEKVVSCVKRIISPYKINCAQNNFCFSMQDSIDGIISLCWCFDDSDNLLFKFNFGEKYDLVKNKLSENRRTEFNIVNKSFEDKGLHIVKDNFKYINDGQKIPFICDKHYDKGIQYTTYSNIRGSACGCKYCRYEKISKENNYRWNGGISDLSKYLRSKIQNWKNETLNYYNYKSIFTGNRDNLII